MKICYYNWVDYRDHRGGGVTVYQRNLINNFNTENNEIYYISSGVYYSLKNKEPYFTRKKNIFRIYNSETLAPAHVSYGSDKQLEGARTIKVFLDIIAMCKGFDVIHFNNLEGIPAFLLKDIKEYYPEIKIILSIHNYYPFCPQVNLWHDEVKNCKDYKEGRNCILCVNHVSNEDSSKKGMFLYQQLKDLKMKEGGILFNKTYYYASRLNNIRHKFLGFKKHINSLFIENNNENFAAEIDTEIKVRYFKDRRSSFVSVINENVDSVICVSKRVKDICVKFGINKAKCKVLYIGTEQSKNFEKNFFPTKQKREDVFTICYLGYMRKDKGFEFLLRALKQIDDNISKKIRLVVAAKKIDYLYDDLIRTSRKYHSLEYYNGYTHHSLDKILETVDLGIVPPLWEDNLPQVAIEIHSRKIPLLTSDTGGANELHRSNKNFTFKSGDIWDFKEKLEKFIRNNINYEDYFANILSPVSMKTHMNELFKIYEA